MRGPRLRPTAAYDEYYYDDGYDDDEEYDDDDEYGGYEDEYNNDAEGNVGKDDAAKEAKGEHETCKDMKKPAAADTAAADTAAAAAAHDDQKHPNRTEAGKILQTTVLPGDTSHGQRGTYPRIPASQRLRPAPYSLALTRSRQARQSPSTSSPRLMRPCV
jgi:hypothetical protein